MAEEEAAHHVAQGGANFLTKKLGPLPVGVWIAAAGGIWWYLQKRQGGGAITGGTDAAGNAGLINPSTGFAYGSPQDLAAIGAGGSGGTTSGSGGSTVGGTYPDNTAWASAAINYLVGLGIDPTAANSAIEQFLSSQQLTTDQQADVNLAIQRLGAPPSPPQPGTAPPPVVHPPSPGTIYATNPPSGLVVSGKSTTSLALKWNSSTNSTSYLVSWGTTAAASDGSTTVSGTSTSTTVSGLKPNTLYYVRVQGQPAKQGAPFASVSSTTSATPAPAPTPTPKPPTPTPKPPTPAPAPQHRYPERKDWHDNVSGDNYSKIAQQYGTGLSGQELYNYQFLPEAGRSPEAIAELRQYGPNRIYAGGSTAIPYPR